MLSGGEVFSLLRSSICLSKSNLLLVEENLWPKENEGNKKKILTLLLEKNTAFYFFFNFQPLQLWVVISFFQQIIYADAWLMFKHALPFFLSLPFSFVVLFEFIEFHLPVLVRVT